MILAGYELAIRARDVVGLKDWFVVGVVAVLMLAVNTGVGFLAGVAIVLVLGSFFILPGLLGGRPGGTGMAILIAVGMLIGAIILIIIVSFRRVRVKRTKEGALEAARWSAFRRYLADFFAEYRRIFFKEMFDQQGHISLSFP